MLIRVRLTLIAMLAASPIAAQRPQQNPAAAEAVRAKYEKVEVRISMRDGAKLFTSIYSPRDAKQDYPILMSRTPYGVAPYGPDAYRPSLGPSSNPKFAESGFIFVYQDARGRFNSEGAYKEMTPHKDVKQSNQDVDESTDTYDTIEWLIKNVPRNNGRVGIYGTSYPGFYTTASCINPHPALKVCSPQAPMTDVARGDDLFHNGAFYIGANFSFYQGFGRTPRNPNLGPDPSYPRPQTGNDAYKFFLEMGPIGPGSRKYLPPDTAPLWNLVLQHPNYDGFWKVRDIRPHLKKVAPAMMEVGGYYDAEDLFGPWGTFRAIEKLAKGTDNHIVVGPWPHGGWARGDGDAFGDLRWNYKAGPYYRDAIEFPFFLHHLKGAPDPKLPRVLVFRTGADRWDSYDTFPPKSAAKKAFYLQPGGRLDFEPPKGGAEYDEYISDPSNPVPVVGRMDPSGMPRDYMTGDQRFASKRPDVITFQTDVLKEDVTIAGPVSPVLHVATSGTDADFVVKLIDVFPDDAPDWPGDSTGFKVAGYQQLVRGEPFRGKFRKSFEKPVPFKKMEPDSLSFEMPDIYHTFRKGHRIMVQIQSSWFPLTDRNPQTFVPNIFEAKPEDFQKAAMRVFHSRRKASRLDVSVVR
jgi:putative CocE/NonD family hydrolase